MKNIFKGILSRSKVNRDSNVVLQNVQTVNLGLSLQDAKQIALEVFNKNFYRVTTEARKYK
jgi:hypothetical protein